MSRTPDSDLRSSSSSIKNAVLQFSGTVSLVEFDCDTFSGPKLTRLGRRQPE